MNLSENKKKTHNLFQKQKRSCNYERDGQQPDSLLSQKQNFCSPADVNKLLLETKSTRQLKVENPRKGCGVAGRAAKVSFIKTDSQIMMLFSPFFVLFYIVVLF